MSSTSLIITSCWGGRRNISFIAETGSYGTYQTREILIRFALGLRRNREHVYREEDGDPWPPFTPEELPGWTKKVAPADKDLLRLSVPPESLDAEGNLVLEANGKSPNFARRNIITNSGWFYTI
ncbi:hypothetical protein IFM61392_06436 [Aspergillus lentulus]|nr:hypothetical protein IFM61392_06436 [Aspergillus lentulus]